MGDRGSRSKTPDLFTTPSVRQPASPSAAPSARHVLPKDLAGAIKHLSDHELERLAAAALAEQKCRGRNSDRLSDKRKVDLGVTLTPSKVNAVRAAFKAGVKPSQIARQFGISRTDVQKALASGRE